MFVTAAKLVLVASLICIDAAAQLPARLERCLPTPSYGRELRDYQDSIKHTPYRVEVDIHVESAVLTPAGRKALRKNVAQSFFDRDDWKVQIRERVKHQFQTLGYFKAEVEILENGISGDPKDRIRKIKARAVVREGPLYRLGEVRFEHGTAFTTPQLRSLFTIHEGDIFNTERIVWGLETLRKTYGERGYINFTPIAETMIDEGTKTISLNISLDEGPQYRISEIKALGLDQAAADRMLKEIDLGPGSVYDSAKLEEGLIKINGQLLKGRDAPADSETTRNDKNATVSIVLDFRQCPI